MIYNEKHNDLFKVPQGYYLAHCISGDYALGAGIAKKFVEVYNMRYKLFKKYPIPMGEKYANVGKALLIDNVFNLVTKPRCFHKPTYDTLYETLEDMKRQCEELDIDKIAMPLIGCGLDKLEWDKVSEIIEEVFDDMDIEIMVCKLNTGIARKAMLSQPMAGKTEEEIVATREKAIKVLEEKGYEVVNTLFTDEWYSKTQMENRGVIQIPLCFLAKSLENMSLCNAAYFCKGWENARGCRIEHDAAMAYGLTIIYEE